MYVYLYIYMHMRTYMVPPPRPIYIYIHIIYKWWIFQAMIDKKSPCRKALEKRAGTACLQVTLNETSRRWEMDEAGWCGGKHGTFLHPTKSVTGNLLFLASCQKKCKEVFNHHCSGAMFLRESRTFSCRNTKLCTCMHHAIFISLSSRIWPKPCSTNLLQKTSLEWVATNKSSAWHIAFKS